MTVSPDDEDPVVERVRNRWDRLTKPPGSLGDLEEWVVRLAAIQQRTIPRVRPAAVLLFAGDHGVTEENVSAYPPAVTEQMLANIDRGGAAINAIAASAGVELRWFNVGCRSNHQRDGEKIAGGTRNLRRRRALPREHIDDALAVGRRAVREAGEDGVELVGLGEIGIGNTTPTTALIAALLDRDPADIVGPGTGLDEAGLRRKRRVVREALKHHEPDPNDARDLLGALGGYELAAQVGAILEASKRGLPVVLDGVITAASALVAGVERPACRTVMLASHRSAEPAHDPALEALDLDPMVDLNLRLGEGTGAALVVPLLDAALAAYRDMATFEDAGVENGLE